jgi:hypothetical protein
MPLSLPQTDQQTTPLPQHFQGDPLAQDKVLRDYLDGFNDLAYIAKANKLTIDELLAWINSEPFQRRLRALEQAADRRTQSLAKIYRHKALEKLADLLRDNILSPEEQRRTATTLARECAKIEREVAAAARPKATARPAPSPQGGGVSCAPHEAEGAPPSTSPTPLVASEPEPAARPHDPSPLLLRPSPRPPPPRGISPTPPDSLPLRIPATGGGTLAAPRRFPR